MIDFEEYIRQGDPQQQEKSYAWQTAIGLQAVDNLQPSKYLIETARKDIVGEISIDEAEKLLKSYYRSKESHTPDGEETHEADTAAINIRRLLTEKTFAFSIVGLLSIHRRIFQGVFKFAGKIREYNITKKEWVLRGDTVLYVSATDIRKAIEYDLDQERQFDYSKIDGVGLVKHIAQFVSGLWQIHPFEEGNTRTTAVFTILYLRSMGFDVANDLFANHSWYFRNALVRANYQNVKKGIMRDSIYLELFFRNLLLGETNELRNRNMVVDAPKELFSQQIQQEDRTSTEQVTEQESNKSCTNAEQTTVQIPEELFEHVTALIFALTSERLSLKALMEKVGLKHRPTFVENYIEPAFETGVMQLLYPDKPKHPRQKYLLTPKGLALYNELKKKQL